MHCRYFKEKIRSTLTGFALLPPKRYILYIIWGCNIFDVCEICTQANAQPGNGFQEWRPAEAILFCIWAISNYVSVVEAEVMPQVCIMDSFCMCIFIYRAATISFVAVCGIWVSHLVFLLDRWVGLCPIKSLCLKFWNNFTSILLCYTCVSSMEISFFLHSTFRWWPCFRIFHSKRNCFRQVIRLAYALKKPYVCEAVSLVMRHLFPYLLSACLLVGAYSKWLNAAPASVSILPSIIRILMSGMGASEDCAAAAALAFRHICDGIVFILPNLTSLPYLFTTKHNNDIMTSMHIPQNLLYNFFVVSRPWLTYFYIDILVVANYLLVIKE